uniref:4a-hydroxytetrahydrobiopterin dehydratase n=1 Tax=Kalanchoe fedtschenkoi TaxID=63787 RepID=A0A7N0ZZD1_KALFE
MATLVPAAPAVKPHDRLLRPPSRRLFLIPSTSRTCSRRPFPRCRSMMGGARGDGDFGARDPFPAEIASNFGDKVLGNKDTEHKILIPNLAALSLAQQQISTTFTQPMPEDHAQQLLRKVIGWRLVNDGAGLKLQCLWKLKDYKSGVELINRIYNAVESTAHYPTLHLEQPNQVRAELWTASVGGLTMNDFIVASKIDGVKISDLLPRKRAWA